VKRLEFHVRQNPQQYFWFHRRWKTTPEDLCPPAGTAGAEQMYNAASDPHDAVRRNRTGKESGAK
jgi:hypothetical protein